MTALSLSSSSSSPSDSTSPESSSSSLPSKRKTPDSSSSTSSLPRTTLLLADGSQVNLLESSPFEPLIKGARWPDSHLEILKAAFDRKEDTISLPLRRPLASYLSVPYPRIVRWISTRKESIQKEVAVKREGDLRRESVGEVKVEEDDADVVARSWREARLMGQGSVGTDVVKMEDVRHEDVDVEGFGPGVGGRVVVGGREVATTERQEEKVGFALRFPSQYKPAFDLELVWTFLPNGVLLFVPFTLQIFTSSTETDAYTQAVASPRSSSSLSLHDRLTTSLETSPAPFTDIIQSIKPSKPILLSPSSILAQFNTPSRLPLPPPPPPSLPPLLVASSISSSQESSTRNSLSDLDLFISISQQSSSYPNSQSSDLPSNLSIAASSEGAAPVTTLSFTAPSPSSSSSSTGLTLNLLARQRERERSQEEQKRSDASVISSSSFVALSPLAFGPERVVAAFHEVVQAETSSIQRKRRASSLDDDGFESASCPPPPSKLVKLSPRPNGVGAEMDDGWLKNLTEGWFGEGWRWRERG
ncbi:hypothetical protein BDY24DRAFT_174049 [Mrakia frigida]|uniref:uncharacterized protein n=1 Tax=Mrakia frigida TaxID=29902 RepID=UPI003FCC0DE4